MAAQTLYVSVFLRMAGPSQFATAEEKITNSYPTDTPASQQIAFGAFIGARDAVQDMSPATKGAHYGVIASSTPLTP